MKGTAIKHRTVIGSSLNHSDKRERWWAHSHQEPSENLHRDERAPLDSRALANDAHHSRRPERAKQQPRRGAEQEPTNVQTARALALHERRRVVLLTVTITITVAGARRVAAKPPECNHAQHAQQRGGDHEGQGQRAAQVRMVMVTIARTGT